MFLRHTVYSLLPFLLARTADEVRSFLVDLLVTFLSIFVMFSLTGIFIAKLGIWLPSVPQFFPKCRNIYENIAIKLK